MTTKYIVVSLPRTGTKSMCQMMSHLGFNVQHVPGPSYKAFLGRDDIDVYADTPMFQLTVIKEILDSDIDSKFIYLEKDSVAWFNSMEKVGLVRAYLEMYEQTKNSPETMSVHNKTDFEALHSIFNGDSSLETAPHSHHIKHANDILDLIYGHANGGESRLLTYNFSEGWEPLCEFTGTDVPDMDVPHLNIDTMFDLIT